MTKVGRTCNKIVLYTLKICTNAILTVLTLNDNYMILFYKFVFNSIFFFIKSLCIVIKIKFLSITLTNKKTNNSAIKYVYFNGSAY